jgi:putative tryptophan/tyrosine transport system substrate-binding protein
MDLTRRRLLAGLGAALGAPRSAFGQSAALPRIGYLGIVAPAAMAGPMDALRAGLRELGYVEGKTIRIEYRWAEGRYEILPALAADLVKQKVALILTQGTDGTRAAKLATKTIPIVMIGVSDPTVTGLVDSIARPSGNITGLIFLTEELNVKRLEFLRQALPRSTKFAALVNPQNTSHPPIFKAMEASAATLGIELQRFEAAQQADFDPALKAIAAARAAGLVVVDDALFNGSMPAIAAAASRAQVPMIGVLEGIGHGSMIAYGVNRAAMYRRGAIYVDRLLKGAKPAELPIERVASYDMVIDKAVATRLGIAIPQTLLLRADRVVE